MFFHSSGATSNLFDVVFQHKWQHHRCVKLDRKACMERYCSGGFRAQRCRSAATSAIWPWQRGTLPEGRPSSSAKASPKISNLMKNNTKVGRRTRERRLDRIIHPALICKLVALHRVSIRCPMKRCRHSTPHDKPPLCRGLSSADEPQ